MSEPAFWSEFQSEIRRRTSIDDRVKPGTLDLSLAFLANSDATLDFRQFTIGALEYVTVVNLRQGTIDPDVRQQMLLAMMRYRDRLAAFTVSGNNQGAFERAGNMPNSTESRSGTLLDEMKCIPVVDSPRGRNEQAILDGQEKADREYVTANEAWKSFPAVHSAALREIRD